MPILEFKEIRIGRDGDIFRRFPIKKDSDRYREDLSFSVLAGKRTLDLEAPNQVEMQQFLAMLHVVWKEVVDEERRNQGKTAIEQSQMLAMALNDQNQEGGESNANAVAATES